MANDMFAYKVIHADKFLKHAYLQGSLCYTFILHLVMTESNLHKSDL